MGNAKTKQKFTSLRWEMQKQNKNSLLSDGKCKNKTKTHFPPEGKRNKIIKNNVFL